MKVSKELNNKIIDYCEKNPIQIDFDYRDNLSNDQIINILESGDNLWEVESEIVENSLDYMYETETYFINNDLLETFQEEILEDWNKQQNDLNEEDVLEYLKDNYAEYVQSYFDINQLLNQSGNITCLIPFYSNYDCCNSFDNPKDQDSYLGDVYRRVKQGIKRKDFEHEFYNGAYGGSLFCLAFRSDIKTIMNLKSQLKDNEYINIPAGTEFGFFSSFQGAGSPFEQKTYRNMKIKIKESEYDCTDIIADISQNYSMTDVYGSNDFINEQNITIN